MVSIMPILIIFSCTLGFLSSLFNFKESLIIAILLSIALTGIQSIVKMMIKPRKYKRLASSITID